MDRENYNTKLSTMLKDVTVYEQLKKYPSTGLEQKMKSTAVKQMWQDSGFSLQPSMELWGTNTKDLWTTKNP